MTIVIQVPECTTISKSSNRADDGPRVWVICTRYLTDPMRPLKSLLSGHRFQSENVGDTRCKL
jgi:hypothetical protein